MPRPQTPISIGEATGAKEHNPGRYEGRKNAPKPDPELGPAPNYFDDVDRDFWNEVAGTTAPGVLTKADRILVEVTARLLRKFRDKNPQTGGLKPVELGHLRACLGSMGLAPADRGRVTGSDASKKEADAAERFLARRKDTAVN
ncbi:hypothetical protein [Terriglobus aquaticus]|uniref:Phage terminase, small subunit, putative, P27 family n=1 Tax=Terriglobus aquaticus TaxID=940139 RepID=A0ABW9KGN3_9BACT|nr:hypothetical protein [Terriglobus aquaticus]